MEVAQVQCNLAKVKKKMGLILDVVSGFSALLLWLCVFNVTFLQRTHFEVNIHIREYEDLHECMVYASIKNSNGKIIYWTYMEPGN